MLSRFTQLTRGNAFVALLFAVLVFSSAVRAQVNVTATAGTMGPTTYTTLNAAFAAINAGTHQGAITIAITGNTSEPATPTPLLASGGTSSYTGISIMPSGGSYTISSAASPSADRGIIELAGADNVTIDGDDPATAGTQNLSIISATSTTGGIACIRLSSNSTSGADGANNVTVKNCIIAGSRSSATSSAINYGIQFSNGTSTSSSSTGAYSSLNTVIQNNTITRCFYGIYAIGNSASYLNTGLQIVGNKIGSATAADYVAFYGIYVSYTSATPGAGSALISGNDVRTGYTSAGASMSAVMVEAANAGAVITRNYIHDCINPASGVWGMYGIQISSATNNDAIRITNNIIRDMSGYPVSSLGNQYGGSGLYVPAATTNIIFNNNTIAQLASASIGSCILMGSASATFSQFLNNILVNNVASAYSCLFYTAGPANIGTALMNKNDYYINASGVFAYYGANVTSLAAWKTTTGMDANSFNVLPNFVSTTDMHITPGQVSFLESGGAPVATTGVAVDYDNDARPGPAGSVNGGATAPDIGADEFDGIPPPAPPVINAVAASPGGQCTPIAHNITATVTPGAGNLTSVVLNYSFNGTPQTGITMTGGSVSANSVWNATIPIATPVNANVTWTVTVADPTYTLSSTGTGYQDAASTGVTATLSANPNPVCSGAVSTLSMSIAKPNQTGAVGTGTVTLSSVYPNPIYSNWSNNKMQILYLASELQAAGFAAGNLSALSLNLISTSTTVRNNFNINLGLTSATAMTTTFLTPAMTQVYTSTTYAPAVGNNVFAFGTGAGSSATFNWDGVSNLVVQICWDNPSSTTTQSSSCKGDNTSFNSVVAYNRTSTTGTVVCGLTVTGTTYTQRPTLTFTGSRLATVPSYTWTDGATSLVSSVNTQTVSPAATTNYTATTDLSGCTVTATVQLAVTAPIAAPTATNSTQCGLGIPTASVGGGTAYKWYASPTATTALQSGASQTYTNNISTTTNFYVSSQVGVCESPRTLVTATVTAPDAVTAAASATAVCPGATVTLTANKSGTTNVYSYTWTATPATGSGMPSAVTGSVTTASPTTPGSYVYSVTASDGACTTTSSVSVTLSTPPAILASVSPTTVCSGSTVGLLATTNAIGAATLTVGTGTAVTADTEELTAFCNRRSSYRQQTIYTAAELSAVGLVAGNITAISYSISANGSAATNANFTVKCGTTTATAFTDYISSASFVTVLPATSYTHAVGVNTITFATPYNWDGVSNLVIEVSHDGVNSTYNAQTYYTTQTNSVTVYGYNGAATGTTSTKRFNTVFRGQGPAQGAGNLSWQWNPGAINSNTASVSPVNTGTNPTTVTYTVSGTNPATTCSNTAVVSVSVNPVPSVPVAANSTQCGLGVPTASVSGGTAYKWYATATSTTVLQSGTSQTYTGTINATTTWYVSSYNANCESGRAAVTATVTAPDAVTAVTSSAAICPGATATLTANKSGTTNVYSYTWTATPAAGSGMPSAVTGSVTTVAPTTPGSYVYNVLASDGVCTTASSVTVMLSTPPAILASATPSMVCSGSTVGLLATTNTIGAATLTVGTGTAVTTDTEELTAFCNRRSSYRQQTIYTAAELSAVGLVAGNITAISYSISANGSAATNANFTVKCGTTTATAFTDYISSASFVTVLPATSYTHAVGVNTITFATPYNWDGVSNLVIEVSHDGVNSTYNAQTYYTTQTGNMTVYGYNGAAAGTTSTKRFNTVFRGQGMVQGAGNLSWQWNPGAINSNTASVSPVNTGTNATTVTYTVSGTNPATTCSNTAMVTVTVNPVPTVPVVANSTQCGLGVPTASVSGGTAYKWYATATSTTVLQSGTSQTYTGTINATTTWYVTSYNANCESGRAAVTATVTTPDAVTATATSTALCPGGSATLTATRTGTNNNAYSYTWTATPATGSGMPSSVTGTTTAVTPSTPGTYNYLVTASDAVCTATAAVSVMLSSPPSLVVSATPSVICAGASSTLTAMKGTLSTGNIAIGVTSMTLSVYGDAGNPYNYWYGGQKEQYIFTATELQAAGLRAGNMTALSFDVVSATALSMSNFSLSLGHTTMSAFTSTLLNTGLTTVYTNAAQTVSNGVNTYAFSTPFNWNGTDNVVVSLVWSNVNSGGTTLICPVKAHNAGFNSTAYLYADNTSAANLAAATNSLSAGVSTTSQNNITTNRPNIVFAGQTGAQTAAGVTWQWNPGAINSNTAVVTPGSTTNYTVTAIDAATTCSNTAVLTLTVNPVPSVTVAASTSSLCSGSSATLTASGATTYTWMPAGGSASVTTVSPAATTVYTVTGTNPGCSDTKTISLAVTPTPTVTASASPSVICAGATLTLTANGATTYSWMPGSASSASLTVTPSATTVYTVSGVTSGCTGTKTVSVTVNDVPTLSVTANPASGVLCTAGATATLTAAGTSTAYAWSGGPNTASNVVAPSATTVYTVTGTNSCGTKTMTTTITVATTPTISASTSASLICVGSSAVLTASATPGVAYAWSPGSSSAPSITVSPSGTLTYTVTGTNACGTATATIVQSVSPCTGIEEVNGGIAISIYPNPANDRVSIEIPASLSAEHTVVEITDALGKLVMKEQLSRELTTLKVSQLEEGVYFFRVITNKQTVKVGKVVKQ